MQLSAKLSLSGALARAVPAEENPIRWAWDHLSPLPGGRLLFSRLVGELAPYTGTVGARVRELGPGHSRVELRDRRRVRNHLNSIHAVALANLAEVTTGLAMLYGLPAGARGILRGLSIEYLKKGRGTLVGSCTCPVPEDTARRELEVCGLVHDASGALVARAIARWLVGPKA